MTVEITCTRLKFLVQDLCRAVAGDTAGSAVEEMRAAGVNILSGLPW